jgi:asparagine synthase (glutamine-hydrolysing)
LETRAPFLDKDLYEFSLGLSIDQKIKKTKGKIILRDLLKKKLPYNLIDRPKAGFSIPIGRWIRKPLLEWSENLLSKKNIEKSGLLNFENIDKIWSDHKKGIDNSSLIWSILVFQQWLLGR